MKLRKISLTIGLSYDDNDEIAVVVGWGGRETTNTKFFSFFVKINVINTVRFLRMCDDVNRRLVYALPPGSTH